MGDKKKKGDQEEDNSTEQLQRMYRKKCDFNGVAPCKILKERIETAVADGEHF